MQRMRRRIMSAAFYWVLFAVRVTMRLFGAVPSSFIVTSYDDFTFFLSFFRERGEEGIECTINRRWNTDANSFFSSVCTLIRARAHSYHGQSAGNVANRQRFFLSRGLASPHVEWLSDTPANIQSPMPCMLPLSIESSFSSLLILSHPFISTWRHQWRPSMLLIGALIRPSVHSFRLLGLPYMTSTEFWFFLTPFFRKICTVCPQMCCIP